MPLAGDELITVLRARAPAYRQRARKHGEMVEKPSLTIVA